MRLACSDRSSRGGFVLAFVVLMLFSISITSITGYLLVSAEYRMSNHAKEGAEVIAVAHGGLHRYLADQIGVPDDTATYAIGWGTATVTSRKVLEKDSLNHLYYLRSEGTVADVRTPDAPARTVVGAFAWHRLKPLPHRAAVIMSVDEINAADGEIDGRDDSLVGDCSGGGADDITGAITKDVVAGAVYGNPNHEKHDWVAYDMSDSVGLRWDVLEDPSFPFEFDGSPPNFSLLPADSFPLVRYQGDLAPGSSWSGRGVLVITGMFDPQSTFQWDGIVLTGSIAGGIEGDIDGMLVGGLDGANLEGQIEFGMEVDYNACYVYAANRALSYMELVDHTIFEAN